MTMETSIWDFNGIFTEVVNHGESLTIMDTKWQNSWDIPSGYLLHGYGSQGIFSSMIKMMIYPNNGDVP